MLLGADFQAHTTAVVLGVPAEKLRPPAAPETEVAALAAAPEGPELDDDGYPVVAAQSWSSEAEEALAWMDEPEALSLDAEDEIVDDPLPAAAEWDAAYSDQDEAGYDDGYGLAEEGYDEPQPEAAAQDYDDDELAEPYEEAEAVAYEDGYEDDPAAWADAAESVFPEGAAEPATLEDDEQELAEAESYDDLYEEEQAVHQTGANGNGAVAAPAVARPLDIPAQIAIVTKLGRAFETPEGFTAAALDPRVGLRAGFAGFHGRALEHLLRLMRRRDAATYRTVFGTDAESLPPTEASAARLRTAGAHPPFQAAQNELAVRAFLEPMLALAAGFGLDTERALAMAVDRAMQMGPRAARAWLAAAIGPLRTDAQRQQALGALGFPGVAEFQRSAGVQRDGDFGPLTHAAMTGALRRLGPASPVPIPTREQMLDAIVARADAEGVAWRQRPRAIRTSPEFGDAPLSWTPPAPHGHR